LEFQRLGDPQGRNRLKADLHTKGHRFFNGLSAAALFKYPFGFHVIH